MDVYEKRITTDLRTENRVVALVISHGRLQLVDQIQSEQGVIAADPFLHATDDHDAVDRSGLVSDPDHAFGTAEAALESVKCAEYFGVTTAERDAIYELCIHNASDERVARKHHRESYRARLAGATA